MSGLGEGEAVGGDAGAGFGSGDAGFEDAGAAAPRAATTQRWVVFVRVDDRSGVLAALAERFAERGVSFESFTTLSVGDGVGVMSIIFRGSARIALVICRSIERLAVTQWTRLLLADDPGVRAVAVVGAGSGAGGAAAAGADDRELRKIARDADAAAGMSASHATFRSSGEAADVGGAAGSGAATGWEPRAVAVEGVVAPWGAGAFVLAGSLAEVEASVADARARGARLESITVLPPAGV